MKAIDRASSTGNEDLPLEDAALKAANVIGALRPRCILHFQSKAVWWTDA